jgi:GTP pyrophosphokinase
MDLVQKAINLAVTHHAGQFRKQHNAGGYKIPFIVHPMQVMKVVFDWEAGTPTNLAAAICHDLIEDTKVTREMIATELGEEVAKIVDELTFHDQDAKDPSAKADAKHKYLEDFAHKSPNALIIKLADRACNIQDFINGGEGKYASKYAAKAQPLCEAAIDRLDEIENVYGFKTRQIVHNVIGEILVASIDSQTKEQSGV